MSEEKLREMLRRRQPPGAITDKRRFGGGMYVPGLARFPGDPEAKVGSTAEVRRVLERRGWGARGIVEREPDRRRVVGYEVAPDIIERHLERELKNVGPLSEAERQALREEIRQRLSGESETVDHLRVE